MGLPDDVVLKMLELGADPISKNKMGAGKIDQIHELFYNGN